MALCKQTKPTFGIVKKGRAELYLRRERIETLKYQRRNNFANETPYSAFPMLALEGINIFAWVNNDPVMYIDRYGLDAGQFYLKLKEGIPGMPSS